MAKGMLTLVLHVHRPFSAKPEDLQTAHSQTNTLLAALTRLAQEYPDVRLSFAISSSLLGMLEHPQAPGEPLLPHIQALVASGWLEPLACGPTHAFLPLMKTEESIRAQIAAAITDYKRVFGKAPSGFWLPQLGFTTGIDRILKEHAIEYFFVNSHAVLHASPRPNHELLAPLLTPYGVFACARHDSFAWTGNNRGGKEYSSSYVKNQIELYAQQIDRKPLVVSLHEVPQDEAGLEPFLRWLEAVVGGLARDRTTLKAVAASDYLAEYPSADTGMLASSSWGRGGYAENWLLEKNDWLYRHLHQAEEQMINNANCFILHKLTKTEIRALNQAARELMLAQSVDWAGFMDAGVLVEEAIIQTKLHLWQMNRLLEMVGRSEIDVQLVKKLEQQSPILPDVDFRTYASHDMQPLLQKPFLKRPRLGEKGKRILMLAWEFPPLVVGGLARAVYDLSKHLVTQGHDIHVVTSEVPGSPAYEFMDGIHVHRMHVLRTSNSIEFLDWVFQMNTAFVDFALRLVSLGKQFDVLHAHDWLVYYAARELKYSLKLPLVATIHATEHGRNHGNIYSPIQQRIAELEWNLTYEAAHVITCSRAMENEVKHIFQLPYDKVSMIPNGVDLPQANHVKVDWTRREKYALPGEKIIFYVGRLVYEKGIHVLIEAMPRILQSYSGCKLIIAGAGGMRDDLQRRAAHLGHKVLFVGFVDDDTRNFLLKAADICVFPSLYEPFGIVALEAMNSGTPIVVSDVGGLSEIIDHGIDGYKALPGHVDSLSWHIADMLHHPDRARSMAALAKHKTVTRFNWRSIASITNEVYDIALRRMKQRG